jgi:uncharacterized protein YraI
LLRPLIVIGFLSGATGALADPAPLANDDLKNTVSGSTVEIDTPLGSTVPMRFGADGLVSAEAGVLAPVLGAAKDRGRWWVEGEKLCTKWFRWFDAGVRCLTIARDGDRIHWRKIDDGETGTGTIVVSNDKPAKPAVPAVATKKKDAPAVVAKVDVAAADVEEPVPLPVKKPAVKEEAAPQASLPPADPVTPEPTVVAHADVAAVPSAEVVEEPTMRFGGAGLLEASARVETDVQAPAQGAQEEEGPPVPLTESKLPAPAPETQTDAIAALLAPPATPPQKAAPQRQASLQAAPLKQAEKKKKVPAAKAAAKAKTVATSSSRTVALYKVTGVRDYDVLNVRRGPSEEHVTVAGIPPTGRRVEITGECRASWCPIRYGNVTGWVNSFYLAEEGSRQVSSGEAYAKP